MAINAKTIKHKTNYSGLRHSEEDQTINSVQETEEETVKVQTRHAPVVDHIKMRKKLSANKTSKYAEDLLNI